MHSRHRTAFYGLALLCCSLGTPAFGECDGDLDLDGNVNTVDLLVMLTEWGPCPGCPSDLSGDDLVGVVDLLMLLGQWGACPVPAFEASYTFDDGTASDDTGNGHDGVIFGNPASVPGVLGQAMQFDGVADHILVLNGPLLEQDTVILAAWVYRDTGPTADATLLEKMSFDTGYALRLGADGRITFEVWSPEGSAAVESAASVLPDVWTSVFASYDGSDARLWLHGTLSAETSAADLNVANEGPLTIAAADRGMSSFFDGTLDEIRVGHGPVLEQFVCDEALKVWSSECGRCLMPLVDVTFELGLADLTHRAFGVCLADANGDGWIDIYYENGRSNPDLKEVPPSGICPELIEDPPFEPESLNTFYLNLGDGTFSGDLAPVAGVDDYWNAMRHVWGDFDNDGRRDLLSHNFIVSPLYHAVSGTNPPIFEDAGLELCLTNGTGASFVDLNNDGFLDIYACEYDPTRLAVDHVNKLLLNNGDGTFTDVTLQAGVGLPDNPMGIEFGDYDNDGDLDFFTSNSHEVPTRLYRNDGVIGGIPRFTDVAVEAGVAVVHTPGLGFGVVWADYDNDGRLDLLYIRQEGTRLFHNDGPNKSGVWTFSDVGQTGGLSLSGEASYVDGNFADLDNDGWQDLFLANRNEQGVAAANVLYMNNGDGTWCEVATTLGVDFPTLNQLAYAPGDIDNDGDLDIVLVSHLLGQPNIVLRNDARGNTWAQFRLTGTVSNRDAVGARIALTVNLQDGNGPITMIREVVAGTGFFTDIPRIQTFGLGNATSIDSAIIRWPSGTVQNLGTLSVGQRYDIVEPDMLADINGDGRVNTADLLILFANWN